MSVQIHVPTTLTEKSTLREVQDYLANRTTKQRFFYWFNENSARLIIAAAIVYAAERLAR